MSIWNMSLRALPPRLLVLCVLAGTLLSAATGAEPAKIPAARLSAAGIRELASQHLTLYTDLPASPVVDQLPKIFDQAVPAWSAYFGVPAARTAEWKVTACLMADRQRFSAAGLLPADLPRFDHAYFRGNRVWIVDQRDDYYRRHLLLHEGTHAFSNAMLGSCGPPWYKEGTAELLGTHALEKERLTLKLFPADADDVPGWGRVRLIQDAVAAGRRLAVDEVLAFDDRAHEEVEPYAWCWALASFLDGHPRYRERFRQLAAQVGAQDFNQIFHRQFAEDWAPLNEEWQLYVAGLEYGYDHKREAIDFRPGRPLARTGTTVKVVADRGWQSTGITLDAGRQYHLQATGKYQVVGEPQPWLSTPAGVTIRYWKGKPLGALLAAVLPDRTVSGGESGFLHPLVVGGRADITPAATGTLYLRVNDSPAELSDNAGTVEVRITPD